MADDKTKYEAAADGSKPVVASALDAAIRKVRARLSKVALTGSYDDLADKPTYRTWADLPD